MRREVWSNSVVAQEPKRLRTPVDYHANLTYELSVFGWASSLSSFVTDTSSGLATSGALGSGRNTSICQVKWPQKERCVRCDSLASVPSFRSFAIESAVCLMLICNINASTASIKYLQSVFCHQWWYTCQTRKMGVTEAVSAWPQMQTSGSCSAAKSIGLARKSKPRVFQIGRYVTLSSWWGPGSRLRSISIVVTRDEQHERHLPILHKR